MRTLTNTPNEERTSTEPFLYTIGELADRLRITTRAVYLLPIPFTRVGARRRYLESDVDAYLAARREEPAP